MRLPLLRRFGITLLAISVATPPSVAGSLIDAVVRAPELTAARERAAAAAARIESAGRLADPEVEGMASRSNTDSTMWELTVRQPLPRRGERAADRDRVQAAVTMAGADYAELAGNIAADVAMALAEREGAEARTGLLETQLSRMDAVLQALDARLASGVVNRAADRLSVQSRIASLHLMIEEEHRMAADAVAAARGRLGLEPDSPLPAFSAPKPTEIDPEESPALRMSAARASEADAMARMARAGASPMTALGIRLEREQSRMGNGDAIGLAFMSEIPWRSRRYAVAEVRAAEAGRAAARADGDSGRHRAFTALARAGQAEKLADSARRLAVETRSRLETELEAFLLTAGTEASNESSVIGAVEILERTTDTALQVIQAETAARVALAELWRFVPAGRFLAHLPSSSGPWPDSTADEP